MTSLPAKSPEAARTAGPAAGDRDGPAFEHADAETPSRPDLAVALVLVALSGAVAGFIAGALIF